MPVRRSGNVNYINIGPGNKFAKIMVSRNLSAACGNSLIEMIFINITNCQQTGTFIFKMAPAHPSYSYYTFGKLVAGSGNTWSSEYMSGYNCESNSCSGCLLQKITSGKFIFFHITIF